MMVAAAELDCYIKTVQKYIQTADKMIYNEAPQDAFQHALTISATCLHPHTCNQVPDM